MTLDPDLPRLWTHEPHVHLQFRTGQKVDDIDNAAAAFKAQLQSQYAKYQAAIQSANNTLNYLKAILNAGSNN